MLGRSSLRRRVVANTVVADESPAVTLGSDGRSLDRRRMLRLGGMTAAGAAGAAHATVASASPAAAGTDGDLVLGGSEATNNAGSATTQMKSTSGGPTLSVRNANASGNLSAGGVEGRSVSGPAVEGISETGVGVSAVAWGASPALTAHNDASHGGGGAAIEASQIELFSIYGNHPGPAIVAEVRDVGFGTPSIDAVVVTNNGTGAGLNVSDYGGTGNGTGRAINAHLDNTNNSSDAIAATTAGTGNAVVASAASGLGVSAVSELGTALQAISFGAAPAAFFVNGLFGGTGDGVVVVVNPGTGVDTTSDTGVALKAHIENSSSVSPAVMAQSKGKGAALLATTTTAATTAAIKSTSGAAAQAAVQAYGTAAGTGLALDVHGKAKFTRSGVVTVPAGASSVTTAAVPGGLASTSHVLATLQQDAGALAVKSAVPNTSTGKITIHLSGTAPSGGVQVAWLVFG